MMRDELLQRISALPPEADIGVRIGSGHLDITGVEPWGDGGFVVLRCHPCDLRDLLREWDLPHYLRERITRCEQPGRP